jgi:hypothetical protein
MTKDIEFTPYYKSLYHEDDSKEQIPLYWWLEKNLQEGCLEDRLKKVSSLIALIGADWLLDHPDKVREAAYAIECSGRDHKVVTEEKE